jgi:hypothetical protein
MTTLCVPIGNKRNTDACRNQIQCGTGSVHGADNGFVHGSAACPFLKTFANIVVENHLRLMNHVSGVNAGPNGKRVSNGHGYKVVPFIELSKMQAAIPVGRIDDGHVQFLLADQIHQVF